MGYLLNAGGVRVYIAGDTNATRETRAVSCDVALVPIGGTFTMNTAPAAELVNQIHSQVAIPTHYSNQAEEAAFQNAVDPAILVEIKMQRY